MGLGPKLHTCIFTIVYVHYMFKNATRFIRLIYQYQLNHVFNSSSASTVFISVSIFFDSTSLFFPALYLLSFVAHLVLFTILGISGGVPEVGPSGNGV